VRRKKTSSGAGERVAEIVSLAGLFLPTYATMPLDYRKAYDRFNEIVRADGAGMRLSSFTKAGAAFWCVPGVDDFWLRRFAVPVPDERTQPGLAERPEEPKMQDWQGWEVLYVEHLVRYRMAGRSQQAIMEHTGRVSSEEPSFLCLVKFGGVWRLEAGRRDDDDILVRAAAQGLDPVALARGGR